jgi:hypothetical protein
MIIKPDRVGLLFIIILLGAALVFNLGCSKEEDSLKIVIEDTPGTKAPASKGLIGEDTPDLPPEPKHYPPPDEAGVPTAGAGGDFAGGVPGTVPEMGPGTEAPPKIEGAEAALTMNVLDVMKKTTEDERFKEIAAAVPVRVMIFGRPMNRAWNVRVMFQNIGLMEMVVDDNSGDVLRRRVQKEYDITALAEKAKPGASRMKEYLGKLNLGYAGALNAVLEDERFPKIDYTKHVAVTVLLGPGREGLIWHVISIAGGKKKNIIATVDDYGNVLSVREEERRARENDRGIMGEDRGVKK